MLKDKIIVFQSWGCLVQKRFEIRDGNRGIPLYVEFRKNNTSNIVFEILGGKDISKRPNTV